MAMLNNHKDIVTCPVCFEIYDNPFLLSCIHTVCSKCLTYNGQQNNNDGKNNPSSPVNSGFMCPICKTKVKDATKDHSKQAVVDMYQKHSTLIIRRTQKEDNNDHDKNERSMAPPTADAAGQLSCQACLIDGVAVKWKCTGCSKLMCSGCRSVHDTLPSCGDHFVMSLAEAVQEDRMKIKTSQHVKSARQKSITEEIENVQNFQKDIAKSKADAISKLDDYKDAILRDVNVLYKRLFDEIEEAESRLLEPLMEEESRMMMEKEDLAGHLTALDDMLDTKDDCAFLKQTDGEALIASEDKDAEEFESYSAAPVLGIEVNYNRDIDLTKLVTVQIKTQAFHRQSSSGVDAFETEADEDKQEDKGDFSVLVQNMQNLEKAIPLRYSPRKLILVNNELWCAGPSAIYIHDKTGNLVKTITHQKLHQIKSLRATSTGHVIVACWDSKGLLQMSKDGAYESQLHAGSFSDVTSHKAEVYALSYEDGKVLSFQFQDQKFCYGKTIAVPYNNGNNWDSLYYRRGSLYVCSWGNHRIYQFSLDGKLLHQFGGYSHLGAIQFKHPRICDIDHRGNILIADVGNDRLQVYDNSKGQWSVVNTSGFVKRPHDAAVEDGCGTLWMIQNIPGSVNRIYKFTVAVLHSKTLTNNTSV